VVPGLTSDAAREGRGSEEGRHHVTKGPRAADKGRTFTPGR
jgi:hypothetical protein